MNFKKKNLLLLSSFLLLSNIYAKTQQEIFDDGIQKVEISYLNSAAQLELKLANHYNEKQLLTKTFNNIKKIVRIEKDLKIKKMKILKNLKGLNKKELKLVDTGLKKIKRIKSLYAKEGIKIIKSSSKIAKNLEYIGSIGDVFTVAVNTTELMDASKKGDTLRIQHKAAELSANTAVIFSAMAVGGIAAAPISIIGGATVGIGAIFNDATEAIVNQEKKDAKKKISELSQSLSNKALMIDMIQDLQNISHKPVSYSKKGLKNELNKAFNKNIQNMLTKVKVEIKKIDDQRWYVPFKGRLIKNRGQLMVYKWLKNQEQILKNIQYGSMFGSNDTSSKIAKMRKMYIDDMVDKYIKYQQDFLSGSNDMKLYDFVKTKALKAPKQEMVAMKMETVNKKKQPIYLSSKQEKRAIAITDGLDYQNSNKLSTAKLKNTKLKSDKIKSAKSKAVDNHLKQSIRVIAQQKHQLSRKEMELENAKDKLSKMKRSTYGTRSYTQVSFDKRKVNYLRRANSIINKNRGKPFGKWSKSDQVSMGIIARNLGIAKSSSITHKGAILNALYRSKGFYGMKNQFAKISTTRYKKFAQTNYAYNDLSASILTLQNEIGTLKLNISKQEETIRRLRIQKNSLFGIAKKDDTSDYLNSYKQDIAQNAVLSPAVKQSTHNSWWDGAYTRNYYGINNSGEIEMFGYGSAVASTKTYKPGRGTNLYLSASGDGTGADRTITLTGSASEYFGDYSYVAWGTWSDPNADQSPDGSKIYTSHWVVVDQVDRDHMPIVGMATYKGELKGILRNRDIANTIHNANGQISLNANFGTESIAGTLTVNNADTGANWANASFDTRMDSFTDEDGLFFNAILTGSGISNKERWHSQIFGEFGGDQAAEAGGVWAITKGTGSRGDGRAVGVFRAKKQSQVLSGQSWAGASTFHSEDRSTGHLTYWGGNGFDYTIASAAQGYGPIFNEYETGREGLVDSGIIKSMHINHGESTSTDNTKDFHIKHDEIDMESSFYDTNVNSLKLKRNLSEGNTLSMQTDGHYDYSAWGSWKQTGGLYTNINNGSGVEQMAMHNNWISGQRTVDLPKTGSASYSGFLQGHLYKGSVGGTYGGKVNGSINLSVDFANTSIVSGALQINKVGGGSLATASMSNAIIDRSGSSFAARLSGENIAQRQDYGSQNMISGQFFGPHAEEVGGVWNVEIKNNNGPDDHADGIFAAKKQSSDRPHM